MARSQDYNSSSRWIDALNTTDEEIPPFGCVAVTGIRQARRDELQDGELKSGTYPETNQAKVGVGGLYYHATFPTPGVIVSQQGMYAFNGPIPIKKNSWGRVTQDLPALARVVCKQNTVGEYMLFAPSTGDFSITPLDVYLGGDTRYYGANSFAGSWWGFSHLSSWYFGGSWGWNSANPPIYYKQHLVSGFDKPEGVCWVVPAALPTSRSNSPLWLMTDDYKVKLHDISSGNNEFILAPYSDLYYNGMLLDTLTNKSYRDLVVADKRSDMFVDDEGWLNLKQPGSYVIDLTIQFEYRVDQTFTLPQTNVPSSSLRISLFGDVNGSSFDYIGGFAPEETFALPITSVSSTSTYGFHLLTVSPLYKHMRFQLAFVVDSPDGFDALAPDRRSLAKVKLNMTRFTSDEEGRTIFKMYGGGYITYAGRANGPTGESQ